MSTPEEPIRVGDYLGDTGHIHVVLNERSSQYGRVITTAVGQLLLNYGKRINPIWTELKPELTQEKIVEELSQRVNDEYNDILVTAGGDGSDSIVVTALLKTPGLEDTVRDTPILSFYGGNANMGPAELTPKRPFTRPSILEIINNGYIDSARPLAISISSEQPLYEDPDREPFSDIDLLAAYFGGIGITGKSADELERVRGKSYRSNVIGRNIIDSMAVLRGIRRSRSTPFDVDETITSADGSSSTKTHKQIYEASFVNGARMAKYGHFPSSLSQDEFFKFVISDVRWTNLISTVLKMRFSKITGEMISGSDSVTLSYQNLNRKEQIYGHFDGEPCLLPDQGKVTVNQSERSYRVVTTNRPAGN